MMPGSSRQSEPPAEPDRHLETFKTTCVSAFVENICLPFLLNAQNEDGGWGFHAGSISRAEPTAWALIALLECAFNPSHEEAASRGIHFLGAAQLPDGSWPCSPELAGRLLGYFARLFGLARSAGIFGKCNARVGLVVRRNCRAKPDCFTASCGACLPKKSVAAQNPFLLWLELDDRNSQLGRAYFLRDSFSARGSIGVACLPPRSAGFAWGRPCCTTACVRAGGWNCGNPMVYGVPGEPQVSSTVWALLALREHPERPEVQKSLHWLEGNLKSIQSPASLALALIAMNAYGRA